MKAPSKIILKSYTRTECCDDIDPGAQTRYLSADDKSITYSFRPLPRAPLASLSPKSVNNFPVVLRSDGSIWPEANLRILELVELNPFIPNDTLQSIASDLAAYYAFLSSSEIKFDDVPDSILLRPTYRYRAYLLRLINTGALSVSTANRRIGRVIDFYRWMAIRKIFIPKNKLWVERNINIGYLDNFGNKRRKQVLSTDLSIRKNAVTLGCGDYIQDGEKMEPLSLYHQQILIDVLKKLNNIEMELIHLIALFCGLRIQTVLTIRLSNLNNIVTDKEYSEVVLMAGGKSLIDTKYGKKGLIYIPMWLYGRLKIYSNSPRAMKRQNKNGGSFPEQFLFLNNRGEPYYTSSKSSDIYKNSNKRGAAIRQFIKDKVLPAGKEIDSNFVYSFHWLRATYGMNILNAMLSSGQSLDLTLNFIRERMWHSSLKVTERYLNYRNIRILNRKMEDDYADYLKNIVCKVL